MKICLRECHKYGMNRGDYHSFDCPNVFGENMALGEAVKWLVYEKSLQR